CFAQETDDLFFGETLLHVQSPCHGELDSKVTCYSIPGGRRFARITFPAPPPERLPLTPLQPTLRLASADGDTC
ncbi:hypothetical protein PQU96_09600, partial [Vogesella sp. LYT5W]